MAMAPHQPCPSLVHLQRRRLLLPRMCAHGLQRGGVASYDRETARRWPAPAHHFVTNHNFGWRRQPPRHGGKWKSQVRRCHGTRHPDQQPVSLSVWSRSPPSRHVAGTCLSRVARGVRNAKHCCCSRPIPEGPPWWGITRRPDRSAAEPLGTSSGHRPQGRSCSDPCGESSQDSTHGGPRAMRVIQRHRPPGPGRHWPAPPRPRCLPGALGTCRALAGSVNRSKSCAWTTPPFSRIS